MYYQPHITYRFCCHGNGMDVDSLAVVMIFVTMIMKYGIAEKWQFKILLERPMINKYLYLVY